METAEKYFDEFKSEARSFGNDIRNYLDHWEEYLTDPESEDKLYRLAHSLKSGAAFLGLGALKEQAHRMEDHIQKGDSPLNDSLKLQMTSILDLLDREDFGGRQEQSMDSAPSRQKHQHHAQALLEKIDPQWIEQGALRGEKLYRVECFIHRDESLKRARAFLVLNNLEMQCNVLATYPDMEDSEAVYNPFYLFITTDLSLPELKKILDIDQLESVEFREIPMDHWRQFLFSEDLFFPQVDTQERKLTIGREDLDDLESLWEELDMSILKSSFSGEERKRLRRLLNQGKDKIEDISRFRFQDFLEELKRPVQDFAYPLGKEVELRFQGSDVLLPREWLSPILKILQQLLRNSLVHGIETPAKRRELEKPVKALIHIQCYREEDTLIVDYRDDGRGIDEKKLREKSAQFLPDLLSENLSLKELLELKGLSTTEHLSHQSGRGVGMDVVTRWVEKEMQGRWQVFNTTGKGVQFRMEFPMAENRLFLKFRYDHRDYLVAKRYVRDRGTMDFNQIFKNRAGQYHRKEQSYLPLFTPFGPLTESRQLKGCPFWINISYMGKKACIVAQDLLAEQSYAIDISRRRAKLGEGDSSLLPLNKDLFLVLPNLIE